MDSLNRKLLVASMFCLMLLLNGCGKQILSANQINPINENEIHVMTVTASSSNTKEIILAGTAPDGHRSESVPGTFLFPHHSTSQITRQLMRS